MPLPTEPWNRPICSSAPHVQLCRIREGHAGPSVQRVPSGGGLRPRRERPGSHPGRLGSDHRRARRAGRSGCRRRTSDRGHRPSATVASRPRPRFCGWKSPAGRWIWCRTSTTTRCGGTPRRRYTTRLGLRRARRLDRDRRSSAQRVRPRRGAPRAGPSGPGLPLRARRARLPQALLRHSTREHRADLRRLMAEGRVELVGGTYNEPNTNLTGSRDDDPQLRLRHRLPARHPRRRPADRLAARRLRPRPASSPAWWPTPGSPSSAWARGPFHQWGPLRQHWDRTHRRHHRHAVPQRVRVDLAERRRRAHRTTWPTTTAPAGHGLAARPSVEAAGDTRTHRLPGPASPSRRPATCCSRSARDYCPPNNWVHRDPPAVERSATCGRGSSAGCRADFLAAVRARAGRAAPDAVAADPRHEPGLHRQGRLLHRHQAGAARRRDRGPRRRAAATLAALLGERATRTRRWTRPGGSSPTAPTTTRSPAPSPTRSTSTCSPAGGRPTTWPARDRSLAAIAARIDTGRGPGGRGRQHALVRHRSDLVRIPDPGGSVIVDDLHAGAVRP